MYKYRFSIFTATYNRALMLDSLAEMINHQTFKGSFEWVIVNDGSTDNTVEVVNKIIDKIKIREQSYRKNLGLLFTRLFCLYLVYIKKLLFLLFHVLYYNAIVIRIALFSWTVVIQFSN